MTSLTEALSLAYRWVIDAGEDSLIRVSVVVPVYNAGSYIDRCAPSLLNQSMSNRHYEIIYVNDGSTDDSVARIRGLQQRYPNVRIVSQENSGWPGKPRNVGIRMSRGRYIQFVDQDDELATEALERLYDVASSEHSDIVIGKMGGSMAGPNIAFRANRTGDLSDLPVIETLTGHKMFRRKFLLQHDIKFPEGYWRGEDLLFVARCYTRAKKISILADYTCYFWNRRDDDKNNSTAPFDLAGHYQRLSVIIGALREGIEPGEVQDRALRRLYRVETLHRVGGGYILNETRTDRCAAFHHSRNLALSAFPPTVRAGMPGVQKLRATLLENGSFEGLQELARREQALQPEIERQEIVLTPNGILRTRLLFWLSKANGEALTVVRSGNEWLLDPEFTSGLPGVDSLSVSDPLAYSEARLELEDPDRRVWWYPAGELSVRIEALADGSYAVIAEGDLSIDASRAAAGRPLAAGRYVVWFTGQLLGVARRRRLVMPPSLRDQPQRWRRVKSSALDVRLDWSLEGNRLRLDIRESKSRSAQNGPISAKTKMKTQRHMHP